MEVRPAKAQQLCVQIGKQPALEQGVIGKIYTRHNVCRTERHLLGFRKKIVGILKQSHLADQLYRNGFLRPQLCGVEYIKVKVVLLGLLNHLHAQLVFRIMSALYRVIEVAAVKVGVLAAYLLRLVAHKAVHSKHGLPMEFYKPRYALFVYKPERVYPKALHHAVAARNAALGHHPHYHMSGLRVVHYKVPKGVVSRRCLRNLVFRLGFYRVDDVGELYGILYEEHRHIISHEVIVPLLRVKFCGKAAGVAHGVCRTA